jgi:hypothetical protein
MTRADTEPGLIYFLLEEESGRLKIGWSGRSVDARIKALQCGNSQRLRLLGMIVGSRVDEAKLHRKFWRWRIGDNGPHSWRDGRSCGEWFDLDTDAMVEIEGLIATNGVTING